MYKRQGVNLRGYKKIKSLDDINLLPNIESFSVSGIDLFQVSLKNVPNLKYFSCENCKLNKFQIESMQNLIELSLKENNLSTVSYTHLDVYKRQALVS